MEKTYDLVFASMCTWCRKRMFYPNKNLDNYNQTATQINDNNGCGVCFGILSQYTSEAFANEVKLVEQACQIEHDDFRFALVTPYYSTIRERLVEILLDERPDSMLTMTIIRRHYFNAKDEWKRIMVERLENTLGIPYKTSSPFEINITFNRTDDLSEDLLLMQKFGLKIREKKKNDPSLKQEFTKQDVVSALSTARSAHLKEIYDLPLKFLSSKYEITCTHEPVFLAGRYLKYSRRLPQTKWIVEGLKKTETSIEEIFNDFFASVFQTNEMIKMIAAGREDVDVRCLGSGRPFCLEIPLPKRTKFTQQEITVLQNEINAKYGDLIQIVDLQTINKEQLKFIKMGESSKSKCYKATCFSYTKLDENDIERINAKQSFSICQKTPIRVLHRRSLLNRERQIYSILAEYIDEYHFSITLTTQAGTYIKEFVHGDYGRTEPSICTILNKDCDILELDVLAVNLDFPPKISDQTEPDCSLPHSGKTDS